jgi:hypothetical protein
MGLRAEIYPFTSVDGKTYLPQTCFMMSKREKYGFLKVINDEKVQDVYVLNMSRCVKLNEYI